jgi:hypothetical protein
MAWIVWALFPANLLLSQNNNIRLRGLRKIMHRRACAHGRAWYSFKIQRYNDIDWIVNMNVHYKDYLRQWSLRVIYLTLTTSSLLNTNQKTCGICYRRQNCRSRLRFRRTANLWALQDWCQIYEIWKINTLPVPVLLHTVSTEPTSLSPFENTTRTYTHKYTLQAHTLVVSC